LESYTIKLISVCFFEKFIKSNQQENMSWFSFLKGAWILFRVYVTNYLPQFVLMFHLFPEKKIEKINYFFIFNYMIKKIYKILFYIWY
jgi:hypothetical protein